MKRALENRTFGTQLPCPQCEELNPIESVVCNCGHRILRSAARTELSKLPKLTLGPSQSHSAGGDREVARTPASIEGPLFELQSSRKISPSLRYAALGGAVSLIVSVGTFYSLLVSSPTPRSSDSEPPSVTSQTDPSDTLPSFEFTNGRASGDQRPATPQEGLSQERDSGRVEALPSEAKVRGTDASVQGAKTEATDKENGSGPGTSAPTLPPPPPQSARSDVHASGSKPAVARCSDGTYSYSKDRPCVYRGGVVSWVKEPDTMRKPESGVTNKSTLVGDGITYSLGPRGGCFFVNSSRNKVYVSKSFCK